MAKVSERLSLLLNGLSTRRQKMGYTVPAGISNKHVHVSAEDFAKLFGEGVELTRFKVSSLQKKRSISSDLTAASSRA